MRDMLEDRMATYITGAAMMEPDVRVETNRLGFCHNLLSRSYSAAAACPSPLFSKVSWTKPAKISCRGRQARAEKNSRRPQICRAHSCFVCENVEKNMQHLSATVIKLWQSEPEFRTLYSEQTHICLPHYSFILAAAQKMPRKNFQPFAAETKRLAKNYLDTVKADTTHFCRMFDYRNAGGDWGNSRDAIERAITYLTSREPTVTTKTEGKNR